MGPVSIIPNHRSQTSGLRVLRRDRSCLSWLETRPRRGGNWQRCNNPWCEPIPPRGGLVTRYPLMAAVEQAVQQIPHVDPA